MTKVLVGALFTQFFDNGGEVLDGGLIYSYEAGGSTPTTTWTSSAGTGVTGARSNPIECDSAGRVAGGIWITPGVAYKFLLKTAAFVILDTEDNVVEGVAETTDSEEIDVCFGYVGTPIAQGYFSPYPANRAFTFPVNFAGSHATALTAPAADYTITFYQNGVTIGTLVFAATTGTPTLATTGGATVSVATGDIISAQAPDTIGTAADIGINLLADIV